MKFPISIQNNNPKFWFSMVLLIDVHKNDGCIVNYIPWEDNNIIIL